MHHPFTDPIRTALIYKSTNIATAISRSFFGNAENATLTHSVSAFLAVVKIARYEGGTPALSLSAISLVNSAMLRTPQRQISASQRAKRRRLVMRTVAGAIDSVAARAFCRQQRPAAALRTVLRPGRLKNERIQAGILRLRERP
jgi:hypothetical protein